MDITLSYESRPRFRRLSKQALMALVAAILGAPICLASWYMLSRLALNDEQIILGLFIGWAAPALVGLTLSISSGVRVVLSRGTASGLWMSIAGGVVSFVWPVAMVCYAISRIPNC